MKLSARDVWRLVRPYWVSEDRWRAYALLATIITLDVFLTYIGVRQTLWQKNFFDALVERDLPAFWSQMVELSAIVAGIVVAGTGRVWFEQALEMRWRTWLTGDYLSRWTKEHAYWRAGTFGKVDNPDQRIAEDLRLMASETLRLSVGALNYAVDFFTFATMLWGLSGAASFALAGAQIQVPGYMMWAAVLYALVGSVIMERIGRGLVPIDYQQQRREADFRYLLVRMRENALPIAMWRGETVESKGLATAFLRIRSNWGEIMRYTKRITAFNALYVQSSMLLPYLITGPRYFSGAITIGTVMQLNSLFNRVRGSLSWFVYRYKDLALLRSVFQRLHEFDLALKRPSGNGLKRREGGRDLVLSSVNVELPDGSSLGAVGRLHLHPGDRLLIQGPSGSGKSLLLRALAGLWPFASGEVTLPDGLTMFVPQQTYMPNGSLLACLAYPSDPETLHVDDAREVLADVGLCKLAEELECDETWHRRLSPGEQQRLGFARVLLHRPTVVFLDESTSALDPNGESRMYQLLEERLPHSIVISVGHRPMLQSWHPISMEWAACRLSQATDQPV
ncbi:ABC transporter ATP-binding protein/permease [Stenotrophomonas rhizophila]|uniref:ABC transporter ATP-binding protein/permease n=1 Tax=Stenotrophomonas rhizophila TaxID=216778 RepID=UPI00201CB655|nr:ABC transporter ATP-binding protein/permease [Stenotrophomonas rhizophila]UQY86196.1 ABC transporter ATP-binding protein/permease [Stenotrophomonas rhizophila]